MQDVTASWRRLARAGADELARPLAEVMQRVGVRLLGIAGAPGAGKSTVARGVAGALTSAGHRPLVISLDDYYLSRAERAARGLPWRGPPGTHDVAALLDTLDAVAAGRTPITVQRFSAETDDRAEPDVVSTVPTHVIVEGWVLGERSDGYGALLDRLDLLVFLDLHPATVRERRFGREASLRERGGGFTEDEMQRFWDEVLEPGMQRWVRDAETLADVVVSMRSDGGMRTVRTSNPMVLGALGA